MKKSLLILTLIVLIVQSACTQNQNLNVKPQETTPRSSPNVKVDESIKGWKLIEIENHRVAFKVESEIQKYVSYKAFETKNYNKNVKYLITKYKKLNLDILDILEYVYFNKTPLSKTLDKEVNDFMHSFDLSGEFGKMIGRYKARTKA